ncbi:hypothetical protein D5S18_04860 [Nocardia panacis]|uniref:Asparagine synthetase domain-containing protein n=1 Tax=Nocardia panacis TaxID=2340916 RepID=A0A3A4KHD2_9NOCA|nr:asparagine synthase-related protein [Nocardia panacis]RJO78850.1 hypothetical protein D5S18_04860 [Nocardia panacis]
MTSRIDAAPQTFEPIQYVADLLDELATPNPAIRTVTDPIVAAELIHTEARSRMRALLGHFRGTPALLLSGGVDSIFVAALAVGAGVRPHAITVVAEAGTDESAAIEAAHALGLEHEVIKLSTGEVVELAQEITRRIDTCELWEVTAGIPLYAARACLDRIPDLGPILTGCVADTFFCGGYPLSHAPESPKARVELDQRIRTQSAANCRYLRLVPNFYPALLDSYADRFIHFFQTVRFWRISETLGPTALFGQYDGQYVDKLALRMACAAQLPSGAEHLALGRKSPLQRSSGIMAGLFDAARNHAAGLPGAGTYSNPLVEDPESVANRLYLSILASGPESSEATADRSVVSPHYDPVHSTSSRK